MKSSLLIVLMFLFLCNVSYGQPFKPVTFLNYKPIWEHLSIDESLPYNILIYLPSDQTAYDNVYIRDNKLFLVYNLWSYYLDGYFFEILDLETGNTIWTDTYFSPSKRNRRFGLNPRLKNDRVELMYFKEIYPPNYSIPFWSSGLPCKNTYNYETGDLIDSTNFNPGDTSKNRFHIPFQLLPDIGSQLYSTDSGYIYNSYTGGLDGTGINAFLELKSYLLDADRNILDSVDYEVKLRYPFYDNRIINIDDTTVFYYGISSKNENGRYFSNFYYSYNNLRMQPYDSGEISSILPEGDYLVPMDVTKDYFTVISGNIIDTYRKDYRNVTTIDRSGKVLTQFDLKPYEFVDTGGFGNVLRTTTIRTKEGLQTLLCRQYYNEPNMYLQFYWLEPNGSIIKIKKLIFDYTNKDRLVLQKIKVLNNNLLLQFLFRDSTQKTENNPLLHSWSLIPIKDLEEISGSNNIADEMHLSISPNPCSSGFYIRSKSLLPEEIRICDINGQLVLRQKMTSQYQWIDFNDNPIPPGLYFICFVTNGRKSNTQKLIVE